jgi:hypothetical protein
MINKCACFVSANNGVVETEPRLAPLQRQGSAYAGLAGLGFQRLGSSSLTSWLFMQGGRPSTSVRYPCGLMPRRRQL